MLKCSVKCRRFLMHCNNPIKILRVPLRPMMNYDPCILVVRHYTTKMFGNAWQLLRQAAANFLLAIVGLALLAFFVGKPVPQNFSETGIDSVQAGSLAQRAGLQAGDLVLSVNAQQIESFAMLISIVQNSQGQPLRMEIDRYGSRQFITVSPQAIESETNAKPVYRLGITAKLLHMKKLVCMTLLLWE